MLMDGLVGVLVVEWDGEGKRQDETNPSPAAEALETIHLHEAVT